jgi:hypothetical protein
MSIISCGTSSSTGYVVEADTNGNLVIKTGGSATTALTIDSSQRLGFGVTPSAWGSGYSVLQVGPRSSFVGSSTESQVGCNAYHNGTNWKYIETAAASQYATSAGAHSWLTAASGTAGNNITWTTAMTLDASGNLGVGAAPSAWHANERAVQVYYGAIEGRTNLNSFVGVVSNGYNYDNTNYKYISSDYSAFYYQYQGAHYWYVAPSGTAGNQITYTAVMTITNSGYTFIPGAYSLTTGSAANMVVQSDGQLNRSTSSLRYKNIVSKDLDALADKFMSLEGFTYTSKSPIDGDRLFVGIGAEDADAAGLKELVVYGPDGQCENFMYDRTVALLLNIIKRQEARIAALEAK